MNMSPTAPTDNNIPSPEGRKQSPPAFLDLADSAARLGSNMSELSARVELKRLEHERQRALQRKMFEDQMHALEQQQAQELLSIPFDANHPNGANGAHLAVSAPTTPPRLNVVLDPETDIHPSQIHQSVDPESLSKAVGAADKRKSVTYAPSVKLSPDLGGNQAYGRAGAKSMPASRRTSASSYDEDLAPHLLGLSLIGERSTRDSSPQVPASASILTRGSRYNDDGARYGNVYNAGMMLDEQLDQEMQHAMSNLPTSDEDKYHGTYSNKISAASAALDLAHASQTSPRTSFANRTLENRDAPSEWPQFTTATRGSDGLAARRTVTNPNLPVNGDLGGKLGSVSASATPLVPQHAQAHGHLLSSSRRGSPPSISEGLAANTRSVPATPLGIANNPAALHKSPITPLTSDSHNHNGRVASTQGHLTPHQVNDHALSPGDLQASLSRVHSSGYENGSRGMQSALEESIQAYGSDPVYGLNGSLEPHRYNSYGFDAPGRTASLPQNTSGSTALYHHNGTRYGLGLPGRTNGSAPDGKMNGLHGPKHKRGDVDLNRFTGTRLEDLQGEILALCKDQHGCRYLQKKLEEGVPEHRDIIFRETFGHFADLMTDPFGNYLCQKLLEFSTDEQRTVICDSVAKDLVTISLNMHGTRAVQKMVDFLSTRRQADARYHAQIHSIILALSLHVVVLIKDLNGNHVIQKCLNKLSPEDNQFIYNAVAANCVEVATHRHGCCVLQRCVDHASEHQRVQLINEIIYNALTLVQDPYGNYVVQYILDLNDNRFSDAVIRQFMGNICALSVQKFSSNVIEKCVRVAEHNTRKMMIDELLNRTRLEKLLRDSYGNYCVQTALDYAEPTQRALLVEGIRPVLPLIRNTPYGKRIQNKLQRETMDQFSGYHNQQALVTMALANQGMGITHGGARHMHQNNNVQDMFSQNGLYPMQQNSYTQGQVHSMPTGSSIDSYVLQNNSPHNQSISPVQSNGNGYVGGGYGSVNPFGGALHSTSNDPYHRSNYGGYGM